MRQTYIIDNPAYHTFYEVLGAPADCPFAQLKKAYFRRAKECHPDLHPGDPAREAEFKLLVNAFDVLSDPDQRRRYDEHLLAAAGGGAAGGARPVSFGFAVVDGAIMDSLADDILEELIVGNTVPLNATLQTLLRDLASTERFVRFREGKMELAQGHLHQALRLFVASCDESPGNVLYHYYAGLTAANFGPACAAIEAVVSE